MIENPGGGSEFRVYLKISYNVFSVLLHTLIMELIMEREGDSNL